MDGRGFGSKIGSGVRWRLLGTSIAASLLSLAMTVGLTTNASAYTLEGYRWCSQPPPGQCCAHLNAQMSSYMYQYDTNGWNNGMAAWSNDPNDSVYITGSTSSISAISLSDTWDNSVDWSGYTWYGGSNGCFSWSQSDLNAYKTQYYAAPKVQAAAAHELGHVLGLWHHDYCYLMGTVLQTVYDTCGIDSPTTDEDNGSWALY